MLLPLINRHFVSGVFDEAVYRAADAAEMPSTLSSGFDGDACVWRWMSPLNSGSKMCEVLFRLGRGSPGTLGAEVGVLVSTASVVPRSPEWRSVARGSCVANVGIDEKWLTEQLAIARDLAKSLA
jgi:hypothetical protein